MSGNSRLYFEDMEEGHTVESASHTITAEEIDAFAALSGDNHLLHTDADYAATTPFGERIAHGMLVLSVATGLATKMGDLTGTVEAFTGVDWKFRAPVKIDDEVRVRLEVLKKRSMPGYDGGLVTFKAAILNQNERAVQKGTWTLLIRSRPSS